MPKVNIVLDASSLDTFLLCPTKFNYRYNLDKVTLVKAKPLDRGELVHLGLEAYYKALRDNKRYEEAVDSMLVATRVGIATSDLETNESNRVLDVLEEHAERWRIDDQGFNIIAVEEPFSYILYEDDNFRIVMTGKIDLLISNNLHDSMPMDHKSYDRDFPVKRMTNQFCNYAYATGSNFLLVNRIGFQTSIKPEIKHKRIPLSYDPIFLEQWRQNVIIWCMNYYDCVSTNSYPMNFTSCDKFNRLCEYYEICDTTGDDNKVWKLNTNFKTVDKWDVTSKLKKDKVNG